VSVVDRPGIEDEFLAHQVEQFPERFDGWRHEVALDTGDRGL
jgi:hypothetical protein